MEGMQMIILVSLFVFSTLLTIILIVRLYEKRNGSIDKSNSSDNKSLNQTATSTSIHSSLDKSSSCLKALKQPDSYDLISTYFIISTDEYLEEEEIGTYKWFVYEELIDFLWDKFSTQCQKENIYIWINDSVGFNTKETLDNYISCYLSLSSNSIKLSTRKHVDYVEDDYNYSYFELGDIDDSDHEEDNIEKLYIHCIEVRIEYENYFRKNNQ